MKTRKHSMKFGDSDYIHVETTIIEERAFTEPIYFRFGVDQFSGSAFLTIEQAEFLALALLAELKDQGYTLGGGSHER